MKKVVFDVENFMHDVRERPSIWNFSSHKYSDRLKKHACWLEICRIHDTNFDELDERKRRDIVMKMEYFAFRYITTILSSAGVHLVTAVSLSLTKGAI
jgi:hypothetical protein